MVILTIRVLGAGATHIVGGEIFYTYLGNNQYRITLKVFRDCGPTNTLGTGFDDNARVAIYNNANLFTPVTVENFALGNATVSYVPVQLANPCFVLPPDVCVQEAIYTKVVTLPPNQHGYTITYQRCCRNPSIVNLVQPQNQGATFTTTIPGTDVLPEGNNSAARFTHLPPVALCRDAEFFFNHGATDPDGDSLVYHLCSPMLGGTQADPAPQVPTAPPYPSVAWASGFSAEYPIESDPAFTIDPVTGMMSGTATELGQYVIGVCVSEYRNGVLINTTNRDFQFNVTICDPNIIAAGPGDFEFCVGETVQFTNNSINGTYYNWDFGVEGIDTDTSTQFSPSYTYTQSGVYTVRLIVNQGWPCADTAYSTVTSLSLISPTIVVNDYKCMNGEDYYDIGSTVAPGLTPTYSWDFGPGAVPQFSNVAQPGWVKMNSESAAMNILLTVDANNGCPETVAHTIENPPDVQAGIVPQDSFCDGYLYSFQSIPTPAQTYKWDFGIPGDDDVSGQPNPTFLFPDTGRYQVTLIVSAPFTCPDTATMEFAIYGHLNPYFPEQAPQCFDSNSFNFQALGATTSNASYTWDFGPAANVPVSHQQNPQSIVFNEPGYHTVTLRIQENGCDRTYQDVIWVPKNMIADFQIEEAEGCPELTVSFVANVQSDTPLSYHWDLGDGTTSSFASFLHTYEHSGNYDVSVTVSTTTGCVETLTKVFPNVVKVHPVPVARFVIDPQQVDIQNSFVSVRDSSIGASYVYYTLSDGSSYGVRDFTHIWQTAGYHYITQHVLNEFGCKDEITGQVAVGGYSIYVPNTFSPNSDGINDVWKPVTSGMKEYHIQIYNRWGEKIFESYDTEEPWTGDYRDGDYYVPNGVYQYVIHFRDMLDQPYEIQGHITLFR
ncbi:MAG TPA: PKD domain-containing protein [Flavobacteriales bacterium]